MYELKHSAVFLRNYITRSVIPLNIITKCHNEPYQCKLSRIWRTYV